MDLPKDTQTWLLEAPEPYIRFQAERLLRPKTADRTLLDQDPFVRSNLKILAGWRKDIIPRHDKPDLFIHRLAMLADLGVTRETAGAGPLVAAAGHPAGDRGRKKGVCR